MVSSDAVGFVQVPLPRPAAFLQPQQREVRPQEKPQRIPGAPQGPGQGQGEGQREGEGDVWHQGWGLCKHQSWIRTSAKADEALKAKERSEEEAKRRKEEDQATLIDQVKRVKEIEAIESDAFIPQTFRSSKEVKKSTEPPELQHEPGNVGAGTTEAAAPEKEPPAAHIPTAIKYQDDNSLAHPNLFIEKAEAEEKWFQRLVALRQERLMGSPVA
ncbi:PREDICTED: serine/Arginine-related protein 53 [Corvus brachyrhynchos]|uniref:serine/Arginine-related protein 53 n=1 Tax=Corvus brachyrhynchos TaxID=85066 RepID=UPI00081662FF|nr:PREDICTED: serine/Arginine-related protein 53 [Corvus brachyrhynchos]